MRFFPFAVLFVVVLLIFGRVFEIRPFEGDNLYILQWADSATPADVLLGDPDIYPEWRPLAYATVWLQYRMAGIHQLRDYFLFNLVLWTACGYLVYRIVVNLVGSAPAAMLAAAIVVTSSKSISSLVLIVDRQISLACLFGLVAWLIVIRGEHERLSRLQQAGMAIALIAAVLSKEYGLAFAAGIAAYGALHRRRELLVASSTAIAIYAALRIGLAGGAVATYCEEHGYFFTVRWVCFDSLDATTGTQALYNVVATGVGSLIPGLLTSDGDIFISTRRVLLSLVLLTIAAIGWVKGPRTARLGIFIVVFNALQSFMLYRSRNHIPAVVAVGVALGSGLPIVWSALRQAVPLHVMRLTVAGFLALLSMRANITSDLLALRLEEGNAPNTCAPGVPNPDPHFLKRVWERYNLPFDECPDTDEES